MDRAAADWTYALLVAALATGCASRPKNELEQPVGISTSYHATVECPPTTPPPPTRAEERECELPSFLFKHGSALISPAEDRELGRIAGCLTTGPLARATVIAVGHADPVGGERETLQLAFERATTIRDFLVAHGVAPDRVLATSAGAFATAASVPGARVDLVKAPTQRPARRVE